MVEGIPILKDTTSYNVSKRLNQFSVALAAISSGNLVATATSLQTGEKLTEMENHAISKVAGGQEYHFECSFCHQSFNKVVY